VNLLLLAAVANDALATVAAADPLVADITVDNEVE